MNDAVRGGRGRRAGDAVDREALVVVMTIAPGVYSRNKMFRFFEDARVRSARRRAATLRGLARQIVTSPVADVEVSKAESGGVVLSYRIGEVRLRRRVELSVAEHASVVYLVRRAGSAAIPVSGIVTDERALIDAALARLAGGLQLSGIETDAVAGRASSPPEPVGG